MNSREHGSLWPVVSVAAGAFLVLVVMPLILHRERSGQMATVDAQVTIGDTKGESSALRNASVYRWPDSEVPRTAERLRDVTTVAIAATSSVIEGAIRGHLPRDVSEIVAHIAQRQLIPVEWLTQQPGVLQMPSGMVQLRYSQKGMSVEVVSVPFDRKDGPAILIRLPDQENTSVGARYFESLQLDGIVYPQPFAPIAEIIAAGWQPRLFKQTQVPDAQRAQLEQWARTISQK